jgi:hypothetical protein
VVNSIELYFTVGLVVETEGDTLALNTHHAARVSGISNEEFLSIMVYYNDIGGATNRV